jgi:hypothetical protein
VCSACGILAGTPDWVEGFGNAAGSASAAISGRLSERNRRIALVNRLLAPAQVTLRAFGPRLVVQSATGHTRIVSDLAHVWRAADEIGRRQVDPLATSRAERSEDAQNV